MACQRSAPSTRMSGKRRSFHHAEGMTMLRWNLAGLALLAGATLVQADDVIRLGGSFSADDDTHLVYRRGYGGGYHGYRGYGGGHYGHRHYGGYGGGHYGHRHYGGW